MSEVYWTGKSVTTSVPVFSFRFRADDEELEEIYPSAEETDDDTEKKEEESSISTSGAQMTATTTVQTASTTSASATTSIIHSRDPSPMKEYLKGFGKRSTSVDAGMTDGGLPASGGDAWRLFHEIKGKIAKTVEEKFGEKKSDRRSSASVFASGSNVQGGRLVGGGSGKDDSSINSDSEDISECSNKGQDTKPAKRKDKKEEGSPKKTFPDTDKKDEDSITSASLEAPSISSLPEVGGNLSAPTSPRKSKKVTAGVTLAVKQNRKRDKLLVTADSGGAVLDETHPYIEAEVESGVEVNEEMNLNVIEPDEQDIPTTDYRQPFPVTSPPLNTKQRKTSLIFRLRFWGKKLLPFIGIFIYFMIPLSPYISGFINGIAVSIGVAVVYAWIVHLINPTKSHNSDESCLQIDKKFSIPDYTKVPILEVPAIKEYHQLNKYEGWMNEYRSEYNPETYHIHDTESVYIRLEGTTLRISHTKFRVPKRAMWNERAHKLKFYHQRIYSIENCILKLLPERLTRRRLWSKKYPICIILNHNAKVRFEDILESHEKEERDDPSLKFPDSVTDEFMDEIPDNPSSQHSKSEAGHEEDDATSNQISEAKDLNDISDMPADESDDETFCHIDKYEVMEDCLYLFARTDREKEDWYRRFAAVIRRKRSPDSNEEDSVSIIPDISSSAIVSPTASDDNLSEASSDTPCSPSTGTASPLQAGLTFTLPANDYMAVTSFQARDFEYLRFMSKFQEVLPYKMKSNKEKRMHAAFNHVYLHSTQKSEAARKKHEKLEADIETEIDKETSADVMWINAMIGRVLFDILKNECFVEKLQERLQKKLSTIKLPYFIEDLIITELDLGHNVPLAHRASHPRLDERGLWVDLDVTYEGTACFTLETKLNLMKVKQMGGEIAAAQAALTAEKEEAIPLGKSKSPMYDSDLDDSAESSDDEEDDGKSTSGDDHLSSSNKESQHGNLFRTIPVDLKRLIKTPPTASTGKKLMNVMNKIAASKYFQQATEYKYIKRAIEGVSNTRLILSVEVNGLVGTLVLNIPPPPSDRLWYGFRGNPRLWLQARPKFGERQVNISQVTSWIEKQLCQEFQKKFVLPNMDDIVIPPMTSQLPD
ncbi:testis-expressed protein 2 isoform X3 [Cryptotermes secundus]|uniref:testis-expressed protein 2 isoform X3 n=1 Tax=Cryptotermes secundus TaxID=105785 RepID=UPI000CD7DF18|nr:testis-expressed protein 2 isoform X3 [Cryptotermes secundus]